MGSLYDFTVKTIDGLEQSLADYRGQALLVVNVASKCGLTPQHEALQTRHAEYAPRGFAVQVTARFEAKTAPTAPEVKQTVETAVGA